MLVALRHGLENKQRSKPIFQTAEMYFQVLFLPRKNFKTSFNTFSIFRGIELSISMLSFYAKVNALIVCI